MRKVNKIKSLVTVARIKKSKGII